MSTCLLCAHETEPWLQDVRDWRRRQSRDSYALRWCPACEFGQVDPRPSPSQIAAAYEMDSYYTHGASDGTAAPHPFFDKLRRHLAWRFDAGSDVSELFESWPPGQSICEIGCGSGTYLEKLQALGHDTLGIEPDPLARGAALQRGIPVVDGTGERLPEGVGRFDIVILNHVLEHCLDPAQVIRNAGSMLDRGGRLYLEVPNQGSYGARLAGASWAHLDVPRHLNFFTPKSLLKLCEQLGLEVEEVGFNGYTRQFDNRTLDEEASIAEFLGQPKSHTKLRAWALLCGTLFASPAHKYDAVRVCVIGRGSQMDAPSAAAKDAHPQPAGSPV